MDDATKLVEAMKKIAQLEAERRQYDQKLNEVATEARQQREQRKKMEEYAQSLLEKQQATERQVVNQTSSQTPGQGGESNGESNGNAMDEDRNGQASEQGEATEVQQLLWTMAQLLQKQVENTAVTYSVVPDSQSTVRDFSGTEDPSYARAWLKELCNAKTVHIWTDAMAFSIARAHLKGAAHKWFLARVDEVKDFESFKIAFEGTFTFKVK